MKQKSLHSIVWKEGKLFVAKFLELEIASQGKTKSEALRNLKEALDLYLEDQNKEKISLPQIEEVSTRVLSV